EPRLVRGPAKPVGRARRLAAVLLRPVREPDVRRAREAERGPALDAARVVVGIPLDDALEVVLALRAVGQLVGRALLGVLRADLEAGVAEAAAGDRVVGL